MDDEKKSQIIDAMCVGTEIGANVAGMWFP